MNLKFIIMLATASAVMGKNVIDLDLFKESISDERLVEKRDARNVINFDDFKEKDKRDAKNVINLNDYKEKDKRDARNVVNLDDLKKALESELVSTRDLTKRKNVANLLNYITKDDINKRKNVLDLSKFKDDSGSGPSKRSDQVLFTFNEEDSRSNILQTILPQLPSISIFSGYIRDIQEVDDKTSLINETMLVVAPSNSAITEKLGGLKPWEFPQSLDDAEDEDEVLRSNIKNFVDGHIVLNFEHNLLLERCLVVTRLNNGKAVKITQKADGRFEVTADERVLQVEEVKQVDNGFVFVVNDVLVRPEI